MVRVAIAPTKSYALAQTRSPAIVTPSDLNPRLSVPFPQSVTRLQSSPIKGRFTELEPAGQRAGPHLLSRTT